MTGRKPKSAAQKISEGNPGHRPIIPNADFSGVDAIGDPPDWLDDVAKAEFSRIVSETSDMDILHSTDKAVLASYASNYSRWVAAEKQVAKEGTVLLIEGSQGQNKWIKHPALTVSGEAQKNMLRAGALIGLSPVDRNRLSASPKEQASPFAAFDTDEEDDD